jgi:hypothetical protein
MSKFLPRIKRLFILTIVGFLILQLAMVSFPGASFLDAPSSAFAKSLSASGKHPVAWIPYISNGTSSGHLLLGIYPQSDFGPYQGGIDHANALIAAADAWTGKKHSLVGLFADPEYANPDWNFTGQMETIWNMGYTPFVNLSSTRTIYEIASGTIDSAIFTMGQSYARWVAKGGGRKAFLAPLPEMNGKWTSYGKNPDYANFKIAWDHFRDQFTKAGAAYTSAWWVFAPNGDSYPGYEFENYYPGDNKVDVLGFSSYNGGFCPVGDSSWWKWQSPTQVFDPYINRLRAMAPTKPILIAQTGTTDQYPNSTTHDHTLKDQWLVDAYNYLSTKKGVMGILYYDFNVASSTDCDWTIFNTNTKFNGYKSVASNSNIVYMSAAQISASNFSLWK